MPPAQAARLRARKAPPPAPPAQRRGTTDSPPRKRAARRGWWLLRALLLLSIWGSIGLGLVLLFFAWDLPRPEVALAATRRPSVTLLAADGSLLATQGDLYGETVRLRDLPAHVPQALLSIEDRRFYHHFGLDPVGLLRAAVSNLRAGSVVQGGSTITQQLAKNLFLSPERSARRKVQEALMALWLEWRFTKQQLLEIYLNRVYLGAGAYGVDAAARQFFGIPARRLSTWQSAMLMGLPKAPSRLNPRANPDGAVARAVEVLNAMVDNGVLTAQQAAAEQERIRIPPGPSRDAGWFADWTLEDIGSRFPGSADLTLRTTLDSRLQAAAEARLDALLGGPGARVGVTQGAVVALDATSGAVRAMVGGRDYRHSQFNRAAAARRQPGSAFKPFVFLAGIEHGLRPDDLVADTPLTIARWSPGNGHWRSRGEITLEEALAQSVNTAAVRVLQRAGGPRAAIAVAQRLGLAGRFPNDASIALGTGEVTLLDLTAAYAAFANGGLQVEPFAIAAAQAEGRPLPVARTAPRRVAQEEDVAALRRMLEAVVARGSGRAAALPGRVVAGKTGTTQESRDAWFIGFTGSLVLGIWLGNDDATPMDDVRGGTLPARLFREIIEAAAAPQR